MAISLALILLLCLFADWLFKKFKMPGLIGMLLVGTMLGPSVLDAIDPALLALGADLRMMAFIVVLLRAGFELSRESIERLGYRIILIAILPALCEGLAAFLFGPGLLGLTRLESALLGCVLGGVSPAIVVPMMVKLNQERRGTAKDIPALVLAGASLGNVLVFVVFGILMGLFVGGEKNIALKLASVPLGIVVEIAVGIACGALLYRLFDRFDPRATKRALILLGVSIALVYAGGELGKRGLPFSGLLGVMAIGFVILEKRESMARELSAKFAKIWVFAEIVLFSMVGAQVNFGVAMDIGLKGILLILIALLFRCVGAWLCTLGGAYTAKEKLFLVISSLPKATVQATIGAIPLAALTAKGLPTIPGDIIVTIAIMSIVLTAPAGAWVLEWAGRRLLTVAPY